MNDAEPPTQDPEPGTLKVTSDLLKRFLPGDVGRVAGGLLLLLGASGFALLQPWPLKLVLDCVLGTREPPVVLAAFLRNVGATNLVSAHPKASLLLVLCLGLLFIELLLGGLNVLSAYLLNSVALR